jgi:hypothetical protein
MMASVLFTLGRVVFLAVLFGLSAWAQPADCLDERPGHLVRSVKVEARWVPDALSLPVKRGDPFTPENVRALRLAFIRALRNEKDNTEKELTVLGKTPLVELSHVRACGLPVPPAACQAEGLGDKCTDVIVRAYALSVDALSLGSGLLLPLPRSNKFSFLSAVPRPLRIFNPQFGITQDQELGTMPKLAVNKRFYTSQASLNWVLRQPSEQVESFGVEAGFGADHLPQKEARYWKNAFRVGGHVALNPAAGFINRVILNAGYRRTRNRFLRSLVTPNIRTAEHSFEGRALLEGRIKNDFLRAAIWFDGGKPEIFAHAYQRIAATIGYTTEIPVGEHTIGVEALFGAGHASDHTPEYARFYGGNTQGSFLYDDVHDPNFIALPAGPLLRSSGRNQAGARVTNTAQRGGTSFQHFNLNVSLPLPGLASPLIPNETVSPNVTLRSLIKDFAVGSGEEALSLTLQEEGLSEDEANKKAKQIFQQIRPGVNYLADYAKIFALKPLLMFDAARIASPGKLDATTRYALGGGLQITVVVAKFEVGYLRAVRRYQGDRSGNFIARLIFQNLF